MSKVRRLYVEKKPEFDIASKEIFQDLTHNLGLSNLKQVRLVYRYDIENIDSATLERAKTTLFSEPPVDVVFEENFPFSVENEQHSFVMEYLPGQYDQRADAASQALQILTHGQKPIVRSATMVILTGTLSDATIDQIKSYLINPVDSREASVEKPETLEENWPTPPDVEILDGFIEMDSSKLENLISRFGLAMDLQDLFFCQDYFKNTEKRDPSFTEIKLIDTYWSDHCRHTTFLTEIEDVTFDPGIISETIQATYRHYLEIRKSLKRETKPQTLMDMATLAMRQLKAMGELDNLDESEEINACSIVVPVDHDGKKEDWLVMFKNETHNHPTEIEPFGGAATCLGGAIRDPLSGRSYVYQAMRITGSGDPRTPVSETLPGKLPQRKISLGAAQGYSAYGNQIGLATGQVTEIYHPGYVAKHMEIGAVVGATPKKNVTRYRPEPGNRVVLIGGRTGRDGCGGATGSSKAHTEKSLISCGAEVQKGNPPEERKIQRLFRNPEVSKMIRRCNDFGAGGVSVAIGELADGLDINLDAIPRKYKGLDGTELAISESQERMAVVVSAQDEQHLIKLATKENLEAVRVATVTQDPRMTMKWRNKTIVNLNRKFLNSNGATKRTRIHVTEPLASENFLSKLPNEQTGIKEEWLSTLSHLDVASQKGLVERFDASIGAGTILMPFGGKNQLTSPEVMAAKIPVLNGTTTTATIMSFGYHPSLSKWSPFHGALYAVVHSVAKITASGGDFSRIRLTFQEYFERLGNNPTRWGKPLSALLGAFKAQLALGLPAIGGKDSMSGSFKDLDVPPTMVSFAIAPENVKNIISPEFKHARSQVSLVKIPQNESLPNWDVLKAVYADIHQNIVEGNILSAHTVGAHGITEPISKMCFGNNLGFTFSSTPDRRTLFGAGFGDIIIEWTHEKEKTQLGCQKLTELGKTTLSPEIIIGETVIPIQEALAHWQKPLENIFPTQTQDHGDAKMNFYKFPSVFKSRHLMGAPRVIIPVFPGTNCEYDSAHAFEIAGAIPTIQVFKNLTPNQIEESIENLTKSIRESQIIMLPGGFSAGDEPEGSGKFIASVFRNQSVKDAVMELLTKRDGLILGICNGFQALIKLGLVPYGEIRDLDENSPTLTTNTIGRHVSTMVHTQVMSKLSPWFNLVALGDIHTIPVSHGEGRFVATETWLNRLEKSGQIASQYVTPEGIASMDVRYNPNGSLRAIEGITSPDGRILGKMGHSERKGFCVAKNIPGNQDQQIFESGVRYFK